jgi:DNA-binding GntR family transcriptional regulator
MTIIYFNKDREVVVTMLNRKSDLPLYIKARDYIISLIEEKGLQSGDRIPTEEELMRILGVSRGTIRKAVSVLVGEGVLETKQGFGTFLTSLRINIEHSFNLGLYNKLIRMGYHVKTKVISKEIAKPTYELQKILDISRQQTITMLERIRYADETPIAWMFNYIANHRIPGFASTEFKAESLYNSFAEDYDTHISRGFIILDAETAEFEHAQNLDVEMGWPLLIVKETVFNRYNQPICYSKSLLPSGRASYYYSFGKTEAPMLRV